jgi:hypothetical protein
MTLEPKLRVGFWEDIWLEDSPLAQQYPTLYSIAERKEVSIAQVISQSPLNIAFRGALIGNNWT